MNRHILLVATTILLTFGLAPIHGATINYTNPQRYVYGLVVPPGSLGTDSTDQTFALTTWNGNRTVVDGAGSAGGTQDSNIGASSISMSGQLAVSIPANYTAEAKTGINVSIFLSDETPFFYSWTKSDNVLINGTILARQGGGPPIFNSAQSSASSVLPAGLYNMSFYFSIPVDAAGGSKSGTYTFDLAFVPEPSTLVLGCFGCLLGLAGGRSK
jgi:hypothetical protein